MSRESLTQALIQACRHSHANKTSTMASDGHTHTRRHWLCPLMRLKMEKGEDIVKDFIKGNCNFNPGVLTLGDVRCNWAKQGLCTVFHMVCGFMRGQMVPLKQEVIDIMTWPTVECECMCVLNEGVRACVCVKRYIFEVDSRKSYSIKNGYFCVRPSCV